MTTAKKIVLLKLTGEIFPVDLNRMIDGSLFLSVAQQIKQLSASHLFGIVIGGGNIFRGSQQNHAGIDVPVRHQIGMLATVINGLLIENILKKAGIETTTFCALPMSSNDSFPCVQAIDEAMRLERCLIFSGGIGTPYFTTDTAAVIRALQMGAAEVWKCTTVDGIYTHDPKINPQAQFIEKISYDDALAQKLTFMDPAALQLAQEQQIRIRVFNIFEANALCNAASEKSFGSYMYPL